MSRTKCRQSEQKRFVYQAPTLKVIHMSVRDIITTSGVDEDDNAGEWDPQILG